MIKVGILGATGYTGAELARLLVRHSHIRITYLSTQQYVGKRFSQVFPSFAGILDTPCRELQVGAIDADVVFTALPHHESFRYVTPLIESGKKVIDLSADFRLKSYRRYKQWYGDHPHFELTKSAVYGLPELYRKRIRKASLVANPGCYPTSAILPLYPLLKEKIISADRIIIDSKSGVTGAGRGLSLKTHFCEVYAGFKAYNVTQHRHQPEIEEQLCASGARAKVLFTPHLLPIKRGILTTAYATIEKRVSNADIAAVYERYYAGEPFVRILGEDLPAIENVTGSNYCDIGFRIDTNSRQIIVLSAIDNLTKGASGQAVQNMNIMCGFDETAGLDLIPLYP